MSGFLGVWSGATDDFDSDFDYQLDPSNSLGYARIWHEKNLAGWSYDNGFYYNDYRAPLARNEGKTFAPIYLWADPSYPESDTMPFSMEADQSTELLTDRRYYLTLLAVPAGVSGAPAVGTRWELPLYETVTWNLPTYRSADGRSGYAFALEFTPVVPEPGAALGLAGLLLAATMRRRG
jgi:hypothetical protein